MNPSRIPHESLIDPLVISHDRPDRGFPPRLSESDRLSTELQRGCCQLQAKVQGGFWDYLAVQMTCWHFSWRRFTVISINNHGPKKAI